MEKNRLPILLSTLISTLTCFAITSVTASDDGWEDDWEDEVQSPFHWNGFIEAAYGKRLHNDPAISGNTTLAEIRGRLELEYITDQWRLDFSGDAGHDDVVQDSGWLTRELNISFSPINSIDIRAGRQVLTWGTGDYVFLNDLFPKDWQSFFSGRDDEYLKAPSDSFKLSGFADRYSIDLIWTPSFTPDHSLNGERFSFFSPATAGNIAPDSEFNPHEPSGDTWSARVSTLGRGIEYTLYGYSGYWTSPLGMTSQGNMTYPKLNSLGASLRTPMGKGLFNAEFAWYDSLEDRSGSDPLIPNAQQRWLIGYEQEMASNLTAGVQFYLERTLDYDRLIANSPYPQYETDEYRQLLSLRLTWQPGQKKLTGSLFTFWSPSDQDAYIKPSVTYRVDDQWSVATGANLFYGKQKHTFFSQHENNSNVWLRVRFSY